MSNLHRAALMVAATVMGIVAASDADAHGRRGRVGVWFGFPAPIFYPAPYYYHPYPRPYYYPAPVVIPAPSAPAYIEQNPPPPGASPSQGTANYWYYCPDSQTYYPYVQTCASQWQQVVPNSAPPS